mgnify:FL=1
MVDERTFKNLKTPWQNAVVDKFQEASWSKPPEKRSKNEMYRDMYRLLDNDDMNDDEKAKLYNQRFIRYQNTNKGAEMQPVVVKEEPVHELAAQPKTSAKRTKRKRKVSKAKAQAMQWEGLPPQEDDEDGEWETVEDKKKKKVVPTPVRRSSRPKKVIKWDPLYDA